MGKKHKDLSLNSLSLGINVNLEVNLQFVINVCSSQDCIQFISILQELYSFNLVELILP